MGSDRDLGTMRTRFLLLGIVATVLGAGHFADHVIRGNIVVTYGLDPVLFGIIAVLVAVATLAIFARQNVGHW